jgi:hypothetical protein
MKAYQLPLPLFQSEWVARDLERMGRTSRSSQRKLKRERKRRVVLRDAP